jgi:hypothetical protein
MVLKLTMVGRMYVNAPVSSNMITTTVTVNRMMPLYAHQRQNLNRREAFPNLKAAAAPRNA